LAGGPSPPERQRYTVVPDRSAIVLEVTTSLGPIAFGATGLEGFVGAVVGWDGLDLTVPPTAHLELQVHQLTSGNSAYDGEFQRHIDARRFPAAYVDLHHVSRADGASSNFLIGGEMTFRGVTQPVEGLVHLDLAEPGTIAVRGEKVLDIRMFEIPPPTLFMIKIEPDVSISLQLEARLGV
jgi:hypothetical protein